MVLRLQPLKTFLGADPRAKIKSLMEEGNFLINYIVGKIRSEWFNSWILYSIIKVLHTNKYVWIWGLFNLLGSKPTKWSNTLKKSVDNLLTNCFSVFDHFGLLASKGFKKWSLAMKIEVSLIATHNVLSNQFELKVPQ